MLFTLDTVNGVERVCVYSMYIPLGPLRHRLRQNTDPHTLEVTTDNAQRAC